MGFFNNVVDEFGKKTGKAIGNKLYGSNADDIRIGGSIGSGGGGSANSEAQARAAEAAARKAELEAKLDFEREQIKELEVQNILNIEFFLFRCYNILYSYSFNKKTTLEKNLEISS